MVLFVSVVLILYLHIFLNIYPPKWINRNLKTRSYIAPNTYRRKSRAFYKLGAHVVTFIVSFGPATVVFLNNKLACTKWVTDPSLRDPRTFDVVFYRYGGQQLTQFMAAMVLMETRGAVDPILHFIWEPKICYPKNDDLSGTSQTTGSGKSTRRA